MKSNKKKQISRRISREIVLQALYAYEVNNKVNNLDVLNQDNLIFLNLAMKNHNIDKEGKNFVKNLYILNIEKSKWSRKEIEKKLENWDITRVATIDLIILQMMIVEM